MSSIFKSAHKSLRRTHKERAQLSSRNRLGLLEKKQDYKARAEDFHSKQRRLRALAEKAANRNPDEFYFKMIHSKTEGGVHAKSKSKDKDSNGLSTEHLTPEMVKVLKSQDRNYIRVKKTMEKKKVEKLQSNLHMLREPALPQITRADLEAIDEYYEKAEAGEDGETADAAAATGTTTKAPPRASTKAVKPPSKPKKDAPEHTVFVDSEEEALAFNPAKHFETLPSLVDRKFNRLRVKDIVEKPVLSQAALSPKALKRIEKQRATSYAELSARIERESQLAKVEQQMELEKNLASKGARVRIKKGDGRNPSVYKWKSIRKK